MQESYQVQQIKRINHICVEVPGSKSITNRALMLAALSDRRCILKGVLFSDDSRAFLNCLEELGFDIQVEEKKSQVTIQGMAGKIPNTHATINVRSAGTAARFLTVMLTLAGGDYRIESSEQMKKRPMEPLITVLREAGADIKCPEEEGHFPLEIHTNEIAMKEVAIDTQISSQFASALLMAGILLPEGLKVTLLGSRAKGAYIAITLRMMEQFGIAVAGSENVYQVPQVKSFGVDEYQIEPDLSGACYFYAMAPLLKTRVQVKHVHMDSLQGDVRFLTILEKLGCKKSDETEGIMIDGSNVSSYPGITVNMKDFSDQTMTMAVLAPFATSPTHITDIGHIRFQETNRIQAILEQLTNLGIMCGEEKETDGIFINPGMIKEGNVNTYEDHRMAMAFTLIGLKSGGIRILNPGCCAKTFENYFSMIDALCSQAKQECERI